MYWISIYHKCIGNIYMYLFNSLHSSLWLFCTHHIVVDGLVGTSRLLRKYLLHAPPSVCNISAAEAENGPGLFVQHTISMGLHTSGYCITWYISTAPALSLSLYIAPYLPLVQHGPNRSTLNYLRLERCQFCTILHLHVQTSAVHPTLSASLLIAKCWDEFVM